MYVSIRLSVAVYPTLGVYCAYLVSSGRYLLPTYRFKISPIFTDQFCTFSICLAMTFFL